MHADILAALAIAVVMALALRLTIKVHRAANAARDARRAAAKASAETLMRAYGLAKTAEAPDPSAEHIRRLARMRALQRANSPAEQPRPGETRTDYTARLERLHTQPRAANPLPARNPSPGLRPHPVHGHRHAAPTAAYVIQPAGDPAALASISTDASPDRIDAAVIHSMTLPIGGGEQAGEFSGAGASSSWSRDSSSTSSSGD